MQELLLTISFSTLIIITFKLIDKYKVDELETIVFNYLFAGMWGVLIWQESLSIESFIEKPWFELSVIIGIMFIVTFFLLSRSTVTAGLAITAVASRMSVIIPVIAGFVLFSEDVTLLKSVGIVAALFSFYLIFKPKGRLKLDPVRAIVPFLLFLGIGTNDTIMKYIQVNYLQDDETLLLTSVFLISLVIGVVILVFRNIKDRKGVEYKSLLSGLILGSLNFGATYYFIRCMMIWDSSFLFPAVNAGIVVLTALTGWIFFRERLSRINWIGIFTAVIAIIIISLG